MRKPQNIFSATLLIILVSLVLVSGCAKEEKVVKIGAVLPLTGDGAQYGDNARKGINLALDEVNSSGSSNGITVEVVYEDSQLDARIGTQAMRKLISVDKVVAVIGAAASSTTLAIAPIAEQNGVVLLSPMSTSHELTDAGDYIFRNVSSDIYEGAAMAELVYVKFGYRKVALFTVDNAGNIGMTNAFKMKYTELGGEILAYEKGPQGGTDFRTQITKIKDTKPEAIYAIGFPLEVGTFMKQSRELGVNAQILSAQTAEDPQVVDIAGNAVNGMIFSTTTLDPDHASEATRNFTSKFEAKYNEKSGSFADYSYDAMKLLALAIKNVGVDSTKIKDYLYTVRDYSGASGVTTFDKNGDVVKPIFMKMYRDGKVTPYENQ